MFIARAIPIGGVLALGACSFESELPQEVFAIEGAHEQLDCVACHLGGEPFGPLDTNCITCHEADRKDPAHFAGQTCNGAEGCHTSADFAWADAAGNVQHDFLPLQNAHSLECQACHADPAGGQDLVGQSQYCWNCHEEDRSDDDPDGHYVSLLDFADPFFRWDCGPVPRAHTGLLHSVPSPRTTGSARCGGVRPRCAQRLHHRATG